MYYQSKQCLAHEITKRVKLIDSNESNFIWDIRERTCDKGGNALMVKCEITTKYPRKQRALFVFCIEDSLLTINHNPDEYLACKSRFVYDKLRNDYFEYLGAKAETRVLMQQPKTAVFTNSKPTIERVVFNDPATIVFWKDGTKTVVKCSKGDTFSKESGIAMCFMKKMHGNGNEYHKIFKEHTK